MRGRSALGAVGTVAAFGALAVAYRLAVRYGQLLLDVERLQSQLAERTATAADNTPRTCESEVSAVDSGLLTLPLGVVTHDFDLPDLLGRRVRLSEFQGRTTLLIFLDPGCGYSREVLPTLAELSRRSEARSARIVVVTRGDAEANRRLMRAHGVQCPVLVQEDREVAELYGVVGSPSGYLIDPNGLTASTLIVGPDALVDAARSLDLAAVQTIAAASTARRPCLMTRWNPAATRRWEGLPSGTPVPDFDLPGLAGGRVTRASLLGRPTLLIFSDPNCPPCDALLPDLEHVHRTDSGLHVVVIGRGAREENEAKAEALGLTMPIALQDGWSLSREFGMLGAPVGYLLDSKGVTAAAPAFGGAAIQALVPPGRTAPDSWQIECDGSAGSSHVGLTAVTMAGPSS